MVQFVTTNADELNEEGTPISIRIRSSQNTIFAIILIIYTQL